MVISKKTRFKVLARDGFKCVYCGKQSKDGYELEVDHIIPKSRGGGDEMENLCACCRTCNAGKGAELIEELTEEEEVEYPQTIQEFNAYIKKTANEMLKDFYRRWNDNALGTIDERTKNLLATFFKTCIYSSAEDVIESYLYQFGDDLYDIDPVLECGSRTRVNYISRWLRNKDEANDIIFGDFLRGLGERREFDLFTAISDGYYSQITREAHRDIIRKYNLPETTTEAEAEEFLKYYLKNDTSRELNFFITLIRHLWNGGISRLGERYSDFPEIFTY